MPSKQTAVAVAFGNPAGKQWNETKKQNNNKTNKSMSEGWTQRLHDNQLPVAANILRVEKNVHENSHSHGHMLAFHISFVCVTMNWVSLIVETVRLFGLGRPVKYIQQFRMYALNKYFVRFSTLADVVCARVCRGRRHTRQSRIVAKSEIDMQMFHFISIPIHMLHMHLFRPMFCQPARSAIFDSSISIYVYITRMYAAYVALSPWQPCKWTILLLLSYVALQFWQKGFFVLPLLFDKLPKALDLSTLLIVVWLVIGLRCNIWMKKVAWHLDNSKSNVELHYGFGGRALLSRPHCLPT